MLQGLPVSPGIAVGRAVIVRFGGLPAFRRAVSPDEFDEEERRLRRASALAAEEFRRHSGEAAGDIGDELDTRHVESGGNDCRWNAGGTRKKGSSGIFFPDCGADYVRRHRL